MPQVTLDIAQRLLASTEQVTDQQLARYAELIYRRTGIRVTPQKKTLLSNRLRRRLRQTGIAGFEEHYRYLLGLPRSHPEWEAFLQEITPHETYLFRDEAQWRWFARQYLPERVAAARAGAPRVVRIWSAACSTGDEPVTIACCVADALPQLGQWQVHILGTDIAAGALEQARAAQFSERAMRQVPDTYRRRFFVPLPGTGMWQARPHIARLITYRQHNLMERLAAPPFDIVFLKNVLIYFDAESKKRVAEHVAAALRAGGYLVTGAAEGIGEFIKGFQRLLPWLYRKPEEQA